MRRHGSTAGAPASLASAPLAKVLLATVLLASALLAACATPPQDTGNQTAATTGAAQPRFEDLPGWTTEHVAAALPVFLRSCTRLALTPPDQHLGGAGSVAQTAGQAGQWSAVCAAARAVPAGDEAAARSFLQTRFSLVPLADPANPAGLFTGYYEPEVAGSREHNRGYHVAVMTKPADLEERTNAPGSTSYGRIDENGQFVPYYSRAEIDAGALRRQRLDLLYLKSPIDLFFLQIQGAGRIDLPNGHLVRVGYAARNGQPYVPIGRVLVERGELAPDAVTAGSIRAWLVAHPKQARAVMEANPAYTFFRELPDLGPEDGPPGALGVSLTPLRSIAVDAHSIPLGAPVWVDTKTPDGSPLQRLMLAQDLGSGVQGAARADIFFGWGDTAEDQAGQMQAPGRAWLLVPRSLPAS